MVVGFGLTSRFHFASFLEVSDPMSLLNSPHLISSFCMILSMHYSLSPLSEVPALARCCVRLIPCLVMTSATDKISHLPSLSSRHLVSSFTTAFSPYSRIHILFSLSSFSLKISLL